MADRRLLMIPGPIEFEPDVLAALGEKTRSHLDPIFIETFGRALGRVREVFLAPEGAQPFVLAGSGTLAMDSAVANVVEPGDAAVVIETGWFSARMAEILGRWGARVVRVTSPLGDAPAPEEVARVVARERPKVVTMTHVDTSTGVRAPVEAYAAVAREASALSIVDGVCSIGGEVFRQGAWGVDLALTASQKALGCPPGLAVFVASPRAIAAFRARKAKVASLYLDWGEWLPVMEAYEARKPYYFATPAVNLVVALDASLAKILAEGIEPRFARHAKIASAFRAAFGALGLRSLPVRPELAANTLSALWYPEGIDPSFVARAAAEGVVLAGGLHPDAKAKYFRVGHMGAVDAADVLGTVGAIERALGVVEGGVAAAAAALR
jgi:alanine-glyoxylate transaminase/serine-glyoxylate transaminase/serine-pyruvate transaminase